MVKFSGVIQLNTSNLYSMMVSHHSTLCSIAFIFFLNCKIKINRAMYTIYVLSPLEQRYIVAVRVILNLLVL